jgi:hypothetical protein
MSPSVVSVPIVVIMAAAVAVQTFTRLHTLL